MFTALLSSVWQISELTKQEGGERIFHRQIGERRFQFVRRPIRQRHDLALTISATAGEAIEQVSLGDLADVDVDEIMADDADMSGGRGAKIIGSVLKIAGARPVRALIDDLLSDVMVMKDGQFEALSNDLVYEFAFGDDITAFIPVALSALEVQAADFFAKLASVYASISSKTDRSTSSSESTTSEHNESDGSLPLK